MTTFDDTGLAGLPTQSGRMTTRSAPVRGLRPRRAYQAIALYGARRSRLSSVAHAAEAHEPVARPQPVLLDFSDSRRTFVAHSTPSLLRGAAVLTVCSQSALIQRAESLLGWSTRLLGATATEAMLRHSIFAHFVAGEDEADIAPVISRLRDHGVGGILDYAAEAELHDPDEPAQSHQHHALPHLPDVNQPSRTYPYEGEAKCEANKRVFLSAVRAVKATSPDGFAAVKVTALGDPALLERVSNAVLELRAFFDRLGGTRHEADGRLTIERETFVRGWCAAFHADEEESEREFERLGGDATSATIDVLDFTNRLSLDEIGPLVARCRAQGPLYRSALTAEECEALHATMGRLDEVASLATSLGVRLMIDAEQSVCAREIEPPPFRRLRPPLRPSCLPTLRRPLYRPVLNPPPPSSMPSALPLRPAVPAAGHRARHLAAATQAQPPLPRHLLDAPGPPRLGMDRAPMSPQ